MRKNIVIRFLLSSLATLTIFSCGDDDPNTSIATSLEKFPVAMTTTAMVISEADAGEYTFDFTLSDKQINDIEITVGVGSSTTATEGVDFELVTHDVELIAFEGLNGFSVEVEVFEDFDKELGDEEIYLTFTTVDPSGVELSETKVITIEDSGLQKDLSFALSWLLDEPAVLGADGTEDCDLDFDMTIQTQGTDPYDEDLIGFELASAACPEGGRMFVSDMVDGQVYDIYLMIYGPDTNYGDLGTVSVNIDFSRLNSEFAGTYALESAFIFPFTAAGEAYVIGTIEINGDVMTLKDGDGDIVDEGLRAERPVVIATNLNKPR